ncbi:MAG: hypothetical protein KJ712_05680 [Bacteroidetes bacterium]|nr:hypothetical protein [Bacteroidota bacterium]MBU1483229.1 hypothetical protein [Bacteroidota bacterium]MBU1759518.1 hypothetical protein [Bacteroidota bacterium]MBU2046200.1 hypothetical protein [Bacteroidota bacterium]MBU2266997.1 hypothetical protein [Bacteroidota bacterium]
MKVLELKQKLIDEIAQFNEQEVIDVYGLILNYFNQQDSEEDWSKLSLAQRKHLENSLKQAENEESIPFNQVLNDVKTKYGNLFRKAKPMPC